MENNKETNEVVVVDKEQKKVQKAQKIAHHRGLKNFWWWFFGFVSSFIIVGGTTAICVCALPVSTYFGKDGKYIDKELSDKSFLNLALNYKNYSLSNFPILKSAIEGVVKNAGLDKYVEVDYDKLAETVKFDFSKISFQDIYENCINIVCTIDSLDLGSMLGDFANLSIMNESTKVTGDIDKTKPYMYYYYNSNNVLKRALDDNGNLLSEAEGKTLYFPALRKIPVDELIKVLPDRISQEQVINILNMVTDVTADSIFSKLFSGYTVKEVGSFDVNTVKVSDLITINEDNESIFDILCSAIVLKDGETKPTPETLTVADFSSVDINQVHLTDIIERNDSNQKLFDILKDASGKDSYDEITINDIMSADIENVTLSTLLEYEGNEKLCDILISITGKDSYDEISFNDLKGVDTGNIKLSVVCTTLDEKLKNILTKGSNVTSFDDLTINDLSSFDMNTVYVGDAMDDLSDRLKDILAGGCNKASFDELKFGDLSSFNMDSLALSLIIENNETNSQLISILCEACGKSNYGDVIVGDISGEDFDINNVYLKTVIGENDNLFDILVDATNKSKEEIRISDLSSFSFDNIKLKTVLKENTGNKILDALLKDDTVTLSNIGDKINTMSLYDIYGEECFTQDQSKAAFEGDHYTKSINENGKVVYTIDLDGNYEGDYYLSKSSGMFGLLSFDVNDVESSNGRGNIYVQSDLTYGDLETSDNISNAIENSTIYQLIGAGVIQNKEGGYSNNVLKQTFKDILDAIDKL